MYYITCITSCNTSCITLLSLELLERGREGKKERVDREGGDLNVFFALLLIKTEK